MKIQQKLTIQFTAIIATILMVFCLMVFFISNRIIGKDFFETLHSRAIITATIYLEADEISESRLARYKKIYEQSLSGEITKIYDLNKNQVFFDTEDNIELPDAIFNRILLNKKYYFREGNRQFAGIFYEDNQGDFVILASAEDTAGLKNLRDLKLIMIFSFFASIFFTVIAGRVFAKKAMTPIKSVINQVDNISANKLFLRVDGGNGKDEIAELATTFNNMLDRLQAAFDMQKTFISNASHELRTPITGISGEIEYALMKERSAQEYKESLISVKEEIDKFYLLTENILNLAKASFDISKLQFREERIDDIILKAQEQAIAGFKGRKISINFENISSEDSLRIIANEQLLIIALKNIIENSLKFSSEDIKISIEKSRLHPLVEVRITDFGVGIAGHDLENVYQTFYRADNTRHVHGHGVGLSITKRIMELHKAEIRIESVLHQGTTVILKFPIIG